ncbi:MAG: hypothetical protein WB556_15465, partial [Candidatus Acidiferrum sp.]
MRSSSTMMVTEMHLFCMSSYLLPVSPDAIQTLERQIDVLAGWLGFWTALVVLGLMMEYGSDFAKWKPKNLQNPRSFMWIPIWGVMGGVLVVGGVAGELFIGFKASRLESLLRDDNHQNEAWLTKEAAQLRKAAEDERSARVKLQEQIQPREFTPAEEKRIVAACVPFAGHTVKLRSQPYDVEGAVFASLLAQVLAKTKLRLIADIGNNFMQNIPMTFDVHITGPENEQELVKTLAKSIATPRII